MQTEQALERSDRGLLSQQQDDGDRQPGQPDHRLPAQRAASSPRWASGAVGDAYNGGNTFPNMVYELLLGGVLSSVLIPLLVHAQERRRRRRRRLHAAAALARHRRRSAALTLLAVAAAPLLIAACSCAAGSQRELTSVFATLLLPEIFFYGLGAMFMAVLNIRHVYGRRRWAPVLNNVIMIATIAACSAALPGPTTLTPATMTTAQILVLGIGTTLGIAAQALVLVPSLRRTGFRWQLALPGRPERGRPDEGGRHPGRLGARLRRRPARSASSVIQQVGTRHDGGVTVFTNADLLFQVPYGILVRLAADRDHAAAVAGRRARRQRGGGRRPVARRAALGGRARPGHRRADRARPGAGRHAVRATARPRRSTAPG